MDNMPDYDLICEILRDHGLTPSAGSSLFGHYFVIHNFICMFELIDSKLVISLNDVKIDPGRGSIISESFELADPKALPALSNYITWIRNQADATYWIKVDLSKC